MSRLFFDVTEANKSSVCALPNRGSVLIGSDADADVCLASEGVFREHAKLDVETLKLEALAPGLVVDDVALPMGASMTLEAGAKLTLGAATLDLLSWRPIEARLLSTHDYFEQRGREECLRCARNKKMSFSVLHVRVPVREVNAEVEAGLGSAIRLTDVVASYGPGVYELLLFETPDAGAQQVAGRIERILQVVNATCVVGVASYPHDGTTIDELAEAASQRAQGLDEDGSISAAHFHLGEANLIEKVARSGLSILILGETGSGKEVLAERVHKLSPRAGQPFVKLNCAAFTESLLESELFGHEKGSFTGAMGTKLGLLETADGGTIFLDEVGEMPLLMQAKMLRTLEERTLMRVGGLKTRSIDVRFIAATNRDLEAEVARGRFRSDLFFRLDGATLIVQPLRQRMSEFDAITHDLLVDLAKRSGLTTAPQVSPNAMQLLKAYTWPGNIRELRNVLERALWLAEGSMIHRTHLPIEKLKSRFADFRPGRYAPEGSGSVDVARPNEAPFAAAAAAEPRGDSTHVDAQPPAQRAAVDLPRKRGLGLLVSNEDRGRMAEQERGAIERMLLECAGNQSEAARRLGVSRRTLVKRIEAHGLTRPRKGKR